MAVDTGGVTIKAGSSMERVVRVADEAGLSIRLRIMDQSTRTAEDAANACGCSVAQIVKSLIFTDEARGGLVLVLVSGAHNADLEHLANVHGLKLGRADGRTVRDETGFAIGGVAPIGHLRPLPVYMDDALLTFDTVWAAAGRPDSVFAVAPHALAEAANATPISVRP
ncbi:MAG: YbaK/EbsC family protein [Devosiaceae bacterium]|nr:YbaK/EbsC family protein [Devosiaceae bacterium MH13]